MNDHTAVQVSGSALIEFESSRLPITGKFGEKLGITAGQWRVLTDQVFPGARTTEAVVMALSYCKTRNLDIFKRVVHIVPMWSSAKGAMVETVWPGIAEIRTTAARTGEYAGIDEMVFGPMKEREFEDTVEKWVAPEGGGKKVKRDVQVKKTVSYPEWGSVVVYRIVKGQKCAFHTKIYWSETYGTLKNTDIPNDMWAKRPIGQFDKCIEAAALRRAFPEELGSTYAAEEMEGRVIDDVAPVATPPKPPRPNSAPPRPNGSAQPAGEPAKQQPPKPAAEQQQSELAGKQVEDAEIYDEIPNFDQETGEIVEEEIEELKTPSDLLTALDDDMAVAKDEATVLEVWEAHDIEAALTHMDQGDQFAAIARAIRDRSLKRVKGKN
jgi:phage recombination protein Bet